MIKSGWRAIVVVEHIINSIRVVTMIGTLLMSLVKFMIISAVGNVSFKLIANPGKYFG